MNSVSQSTVSRRRNGVAAIFEKGTKDNMSRSIDNMEIAYVDHKAPYSAEVSGAESPPRYHGIKQHDLGSQISTPGGRSASC